MYGRLDPERTEPMALAGPGAVTTPAPALYSTLEAVANRLDGGLKPSPVGTRPETIDGATVRTAVAAKKNLLGYPLEVGQYEAVAPDASSAPRTPLWSRPRKCFSQTANLLDVDRHKEYQKTTPAGTVFPCTEGVGGLSPRLSALSLHVSTHSAPYSPKFSLLPSTHPEKNPILHRHIFRDPTPPRKAALRQENTRRIALQKPLNSDPDQKAPGARHKIFEE